MNRQHFVKLCAATATVVTAAPEALATTSDHYVLFDPVQLVTPDNAPLRATALETGETYSLLLSTRHDPMLSDGSWQTCDHSPCS